MTMGRSMNLKLFMILSAYVLLANGSDVDHKENAESYITKEAARELRNKLSGRGEAQDLDYDDILTRIIMSVQQPNEGNANELLYEKKYFDYLPNDLDSEDVTDEDSAHALVKSFSDIMSTEREVVRDDERRVNSRRFKRDLTGQSRQKRQDQIPFASSVQSRFDAPPNNNPWNSANNPNIKLHTPYNTYLPPSGNKNQPQPPHNPMTVPEVPFDDRISLFEEDDTADRVWGVVPNRNINNVFPNNNIGGGSSNNQFDQQAPQRQPQRPPQRPQQPNSGNMIGNIGGVNEVEIEYPPEQLDVGPITTRAPLRKPSTEKNAKSPNRKTTSQQAYTTPTPSPLKASIEPNLDRTTGSRKPNKTLPACVLAIVNCCSRYDEVVRAPCFEKYNCSGAFFGRSPCSQDIKSAAFREAEKFSQ